MLGKVLYQGLLATLVPFVFANGLHAGGDQVLREKNEPSCITGAQRQEVPSLNIGASFNLGDILVRLRNRHEVNWDNGNEAQKYDVFDLEVEAQSDIQDFKASVRGIDGKGQPVIDYFVWQEAKERVIEQFSSLNIKELDKGRKAIGYIAFRRADDIKTVELSSSAFGVDKVVVNL